MWKNYRCLPTHYYLLRISTCKQHRELNRQQGQKILGWSYRSGNKHKRMLREFQHVVCRLPGPWRSTMESKMYIWHLQRRPNPWKRKLRPRDSRKGLKPCPSSSRAWMGLFSWGIFLVMVCKGASFNPTNTFADHPAMGIQKKKLHLRHPSVRSNPSSRSQYPVCLAEEKHLIRLTRDNLLKLWLKT